MEELQAVREVGSMPLSASNISEDGDEEDSPVVSSLTSQLTNTIFTFIFFLNRSY